MLEIPIISGFTQSDKNWNGCHELREIVLSELDRYSGLSVRPRLYRWNENFAHIARQIHLRRLRYHREPFGVICFAYSFGAGNGLVKLAKQLKRYGIEIDTAVLSDGVYHSWLPTSLWFLELRALLGLSRIRIPPSVQKVIAFHQEVSRPMGKLPIASPVQLNVERDWRQLELPHVEMDDALEFHAECVQVAADAATRFVRQPGAIPIGAPESEATEIRKDLRRQRVLDEGKETKP
jgi:hypothetical protein